MSNVTNLGEFKEKRKDPKVWEHAPDECGSQKFHIIENGSISCAGCGAIISKIWIEEDEWELERNSTVLPLKGNEDA